MDEHYYDVPYSLSMTLAIRVDNLAPGGNPRRARLYEILGNYKIYPYKIKENKQMYFVIIDDKYIDLALHDNCQESLRQENFKVHVPLEYTAMRTIVAKQLDQIIDHYSAEDIIVNIEQSNPWSKVDSVYRLNTPSKMMKIKFKSPEMAQKALSEGIYILNQSIPPRNLEKEIYIKLKPCYNCFGYDHATKECTKEKKTICANCASEDHRQNECTSNELKCINCNGDHRTLAAACPIRKKIIKEKSKQVRDRARSRSRSTARPRPSTFAEAAAPSTKKGDKITLNSKTIADTKKITSTILTALVSSHYFESIEPGSFQRAIDKILEANGLPRVVIPIQDILQNYEKAITEIISDIRQKQTGHDGGRGEEDMEEGEIEMEEFNYSQKRTRNYDSSPTENQGKKQKEEAIPVTRMQKAVSLESVSQAGRPVQTQQAQHRAEGPKPPQQQQQQQQQHRQQPQQNLKSSTDPQASSLPQRKRASLGRTTRDLGLVIYIREREQLDLRDIYTEEAEEKREQIARMVINKKAVVNWSDNRMKAEHIRELFDKRQLCLSDIKYVSVSDNIFRTLRTEVVSRQIKKK